jgi:subtilisin family serine protease
VKEALPALLLCALAACSHMPTAQLAPNGQPIGDVDRYIVAAVDNDASGIGTRAGSTPRGYAGPAYWPSPRARRLMRALERDYGLREVSAWPIGPLHMHCAVLEIPGDADRDALLSRLLADSRIRLAQPLQTFATRSDSYNDPYVDLQQGFAQMDVADAHRFSRGGGVTVAIIDTGADLDHPDLRAAVVRESNFVDGDRRQFRRDRHGTEVAGVIAATANNALGIVGVAPAARLFVYKACWQLQPDADAARCNSFTLAQALVAALDARAQVVNLSLAGPSDPLLNQLIDEGLRRGVVFVGAAPAEAGGDALLRRADVVQVAGLTDAVAAGVIRAPGNDVLTLLPGGHYDFASGRSLATAQVTGAVALMLAIQPHLTAAALIQRLRAATPAGTESAHSVDACEAVIALMGHGACHQSVAPVYRVAGSETRQVLH